MSDLATAMTRTTYTRGGVTFTREILSSPVDQVIAIRLSADRPGRVSFGVALQTPQHVAREAKGLSIRSKHEPTAIDPPRSPAVTHGPAVTRRGRACLTIRGHW